MRLPTLDLLVTPIDDESGYGILSRTAFLMGFRKLHSLTNYLLPDLQKSVATGTQDSDLSTIVRWAALTLGRDPEMTVGRFSNLPLYRPFARQRLALVHHNATTGTPRPNHSIWVPRLQIGPAGRFAWWRPLGTESKKLRYCFKCACEQYEVLGFTTWMRSHNISDVSVCWIHGDYLKTLPAGSLLLPPALASSQRSANDKGHPTENKILRARYIHSLLECNLPWLAPDARAKLLRRRLTEMDEAGLVDSNHALHTLLSNPRVQAFFMPGLQPMMMEMEHTLKLLMIMFKDVMELRKRYEAAASIAQHEMTETPRVEPGVWLTLRTITMSTV